MLIPKADRKAIHEVSKNPQRQGKEGNARLLPRDITKNIAQKKQSIATTISSHHDSSQKKITHSDMGREADSQKEGP